MAFSESLTIRILGDSSGLSSEIDTAIGDIDRLQNRLSSSANSANKLTQSLSRISTAMGPLRQVSGMLGQIQSQLRAISQRPLTINVSPAISALQQLMQAARMAAQQLRMITPTLPSTGYIPRTGPISPAPQTGTAPSPRMFAAGGLVNGPSGIDNVSAQLSAGEFVLSRDAVRQMGVPLLDRFNRTSFSGKRESIPSARTVQSLPSANVVVNPLVKVPLSTNQRQRSNSSVERRREASQSTSNTSNHFGGITIQVHEAGDLNDVMNEMQTRGIRQRTRRG